LHAHKRFHITQANSLRCAVYMQLQWMGGRAKSYFPDEFKYLIIQTADNDAQDLISLFQQTSAFIDDGARQRGGVLVHCFAGVSRSATTMAAYLMDHRSMSAADAVALVKRGRRESQPNPNFMKQLQKYESHLQKKKGAPTKTVSPAAASAKPSGLYTSSMHVPSSITRLLR
jgi:hypothetical protein